MLHSDHSATRSGKAPLFGPSLVINAIAPFLAYQLIRAIGFPTLTALAVTSAFPLGWLLYGWSRRGRIDGIGIFTLALMAAGLAASLLSHNPWHYRVNVSFGAGAVGVVRLALLALRRPPAPRSLQGGDSQ